MTQLPVLSASKMKTFASCAKKYQYQYIQRLPVLKHPAAALGTAVHETIDMVFKQQQDPVSLFIAQFNKELHSHNISLDHKDYTDMLTVGISMVGDYDYSERPLATELSFLLPFPNEQRAVCQIRGIIDQMYEWGFKDLKTNKQKPRQEDLDRDLQFIIYQWAFNKLTGRYPERSIWHHLRTQQEIEANVRGKDAYAEAIIHDILLSTDTGSFQKNRAWHCRFCPFRDPCFAEDEVEIA